MTGNSDDRLVSRHDFRSTTDGLKHEVTLFIREVLTEIPSLEHRIEFSEYEIRGNECERSVEPDQHHLCRCPTRCVGKSNESRSKHIRIQNDSHQEIEGGI